MTTKTADTSAKLRDRYDAFAPLVASGDVSKYFEEVRIAAFEKFHNLGGFPTRSQEAWRYIHLDPFLDQSYKSLSPSQVGEIAEKYKKSNVCLFGNGRIFNTYLQEGAVEVFESLQSHESKLPQPFLDYLTESIQNEVNPFSLIPILENAPLCVIHIKENESQKPFLIDDLLDLKQPTPSLGSMRLLLIVEQGVTCHMAWNRRSEKTGETLMISHLDVVLKKNAKLNLTYMDDCERAVSSLCKIKGRLDSGAAFQLQTYFAGGNMKRFETEVLLEGEKASADLKSLSVLDEHARSYEHAWVNHSVPGCQSSQVQKKILGGQSQSESNSMVHVARKAVGSESTQLIRNLMLSEEARIFSRPQLQIYADDVQCSHGTATGQLQEQELFYLQSRGIAKKQAEFILAMSFAEEILQLIPCEETKASWTKKYEDQVRRMIEKKESGS